MKMNMFMLAVLLLLGVLHFAEESTAAPQGMERAGEEAAEENQELVQKRREEELQGSEEGEGVEMRGLAEEEDVGEAEDGAEEGSMDDMGARNQQSAGNARGIITGPRIVVGAFRKVFKKPSDS